VRRRIVVLTVIAAVLATSVFGVPLAVGVARYFLDDERNELEQLADAAAIAAAADLSRGQVPASLARAGYGTTVGLYTPSGTRLVGEGPRTGEPVVLSAVGGVRTSRTGVLIAVRGRVRSDSDVSGSLVVAVPVTDGEKVTGIVRAASDYSAVRLQILGAWTLMLGLALLAVAATWLLARRQARRLAAPLETLSTTAQRLGEGDFSVRTRPSGLTEIDTAGAALDVTAQRLGSLIGRERAFSAHASHQLRTPLTGLRLGLETALDQPPALQRAAMGAALEAADRLERTIDDLLALARDTSPQGSPLAVTELVREAAAACRPVLDAQGRALAVVCDGHLPVTRVAGAAVRQVLGVLLDNASTHGAGTVTISLRDAGGALAIDVGDEGPGPVDQDHLFAPSPETTGGHGIGLALARALSEAEGGRLHLSRAAPPVFSLLLPAEGP
jgi:signal transduction histidine kinase